MRLDFPRLENFQNEIVIRPGDDAYGPYGFDVSGAVPPGVTVTGAEVTAYIAEDNGYSERSSLIEPGSVTVTGDAELQLKMQANDLEAGTYYLKITIDLDNAGIKSLLFGPVYVESLDE